MHSCVCTCLCMHACVFLSIIILSATIILQPSLFSFCLYKQRKRRLVTPPPLVFFLSLYPLHKCVSMYVCKRKRTDMCTLKLLTESQWKNKARFFVWNIITLQWLIFCGAEEVIFNFLWRICTVTQTFLIHDKRK